MAVGVTLAYLDDALYRTRSMVLLGMAVMSSEFLTCSATCPVHLMVL